MLVESLHVDPVLACCCKPFFNSRYVEPGKSYIAATTMSSASHAGVAVHTTHAADQRSTSYTPQTEKTSLA